MQGQLQVQIWDKLIQETRLDIKVQGLVALPVRLEDGILCESLEIFLECRQLEFTSHRREPELNLRLPSELPLRIDHRDSLFQCIIILTLLLEECR